MKEIQQNNDFYVSGTSIPAAALYRCFLNYLSFLLKIESLLRKIYFNRLRYTFLVCLPRTLSFSQGRKSHKSLFPRHLSAR